MGKPRHRGGACLVVAVMVSRFPLKRELPTTNTLFAGAGSASSFRTHSFEIESIDGCKFILERRRFQELADSQFILPIGDRLFPALFPAR